MNNGNQETLCNANINDGNGLYDKYGLLRSIRNDLCGLKIRADELATTGVLVVDIINRLDALVDGMRKEEEQQKQEREQADNPEPETEDTKDHEGDEVWWKK